MDGVVAGFARATGLEKRADRCVGLDFDEVGETTAAVVVDE